MDSDHHHAGDYLVLRPDEVNFFKIFRILWNEQIDQMKCLDYSKRKEESLRMRWLIFVSLLIQKIFLLLSKPLSRFGSVFEMWLNLVSCNGGSIFRVLVNFFRGSLVIPDKESENFLSVVGSIDTRVNLDKNIKCDDGRYYSALSVMAAKIAYENNAFIQNTVQNHWKISATDLTQMEFLGAYDFWNDFLKKNNTQAFMFLDKNPDPDVVVVAFRGTSPFEAEDWCTDIDISWSEFPGMGKIHGGFMKALGLLVHEGWPRKIEDEDAQRPTAYYVLREKLREVLRQNERTKFILTGHSLGGALAVLFPAILAFHEESCLLERLHGIYTFGQPRVGDEDFKKFMTAILQRYDIQYYRFVYSNDLVPRLPTDDTTMSFKHFGTCLFFNSCYHGQVLLEEPQKNYISGIAGIPRFFSSSWELIRSFTLPYRFGPDYHENSYLKIVRWYGLIVPGLSNHNLSNYVNITRLGIGDLLHRLEEQRSRSVAVLGSPKQ